MENINKSEEELDKGKELENKEIERVDLDEIDEIIEEVNSAPLDPETKQHIVQILERRSVKVTTSGIIPSSIEMQGYKDTDPDIIKFILEGAKSEREHRQIMHQQEFNLTAKDQNDTIRLLELQIKNEALDRKRGMDYALTISIIGFIVGLIVVYLGAPWPGAVISASSLAVLASKFISGRTQTEDTKGNDSKTQSE